MIDAVLSRAGLEAATYRGNPLRRRLPAVLRAIRSESISAALLQIKNNEAAADRALDALLIGHTVAFRDAEVFDVVDREVLPFLAQRQRPLSVWSVGCSFGEELLSAVLLLAKRDLLCEAVLRGSDCRPSAVANARCMAQRFWSNVPPPFDQLKASVDEEAYQAAVARIHWTIENAAELCDPPRWDLIFCRNLAIYLQPAAAAALWSGVVRSLAPGGFLVVGKAEKPVHDGSLSHWAKCVYHKDRSADA